MLVIKTPKRDFWDEKEEEFITIDSVTLELEHSLASLSKWEAIWEKPFLGKEEKSVEEIVGYIKCMTLTPNVPSEVYQNLSNDNVEEVNAYINAKMTATTINRIGNGKKNNSIITAEVIYFWMTSLQIPIEFEHWHLSRLFTFIEVCDQKNSPPKKQSRQEMLSERKRINAMRQAQHGHSG